MFLFLCFGSRQNFTSLYAHCFLGLSIIYLNLCTSLVSASYCTAASPQLHNPCTNWTLHSAWEHSAWLWRVISGPIALGYTLQNVLLCPFSHKGNRTHNPCNASVLLLGMELANLGSALSLLWTECHLMFQKGFEHHSQAALTQIPISHRPVRDHFSDKTKKEQMQTHKPLLQRCSIMFFEKPCSHSYTVRALTKHYFKSLEHSVRLASTWEHFICVVNILEELWNSALQQRICPEFWRQDTV